METKHMTVGLFEAIDNESLELLKGGKARILKTEFEVAKDGLSSATVVMGKKMTKRSRNL